jgi:hypothetical protein
MRPRLSRPSAPPPSTPLAKRSPCSLDFGSAIEYAKRSGYAMAKIGTVVIGALVLVACGTNGAGSGSSDAGNLEDVMSVDAGQADVTAAAAAYLACFSATGQLTASLKSCQADGDCVTKLEFTDCCGSILYVGVSASSAGLFDACEKAWQAHFLGPCQCPPKATMTEDGKTVTGVDASSPRVRCATGVCTTFVPTGAADGSAEATSVEPGDASAE